MRITCVGAGPAGLYFAILAKLRGPEHEVTIIERNGAQRSYGWSLTLGADILEKLYSGDPDSARVIEQNMFRWREGYLNIRGQRIANNGHIDICNMTRPRLVEILTSRARDLGIRVRYDEEVSSISQLADADLIVAADGVSGTLRNEIGKFGTEITLTHDKYLWLGTDRPFGALEYFFVETACGWMWAASYGVESNLSTFLIHCTPQTWSGLGFDTMPVVDSLDVVRELFRDPLAGCRLMGQIDDEDSAHWMSFRTVTNKHWYDGNVVLLGDSAHTTHFTTGLGTMLAIEDAIVLSDNLTRYDHLNLALQAYERQRQAELKPVQDTARMSSEWFVNMPRYVGLNPRAFAAALYARRSPLLAVLPPRLWYQFHRAADGLPFARQFAAGLYSVAGRTIGRRAA
jgi:2-polyprenyl-6-methoxyphenol hydroxylase-like FAD-dependent oxidoreductase